MGLTEKEAAERLTAEVGSRQSGAITVAVNCYAEARVLFGVPRTSFMPSPKVDSAVIELTLKQGVSEKIEDEKFFFSMVRAIFNQRRKTAVNSISSGMGIPKAKVAEALASLGFSETARAENFTLNELCEFANTLMALDTKGR